MNSNLATLLIVSSAFVWISIGTYLAAHKKASLTEEERKKIFGTTDVTDGLDDFTLSYVLAWPFLLIYARGKRDGTKDRRVRELIAQREKEIDEIVATDLSRERLEETIESKYVHA